jgi:hypothetical protein
MGALSDARTILGSLRRGRNQIRSATASLRGNQVDVGRDAMLHGTQTNVEWRRYRRITAYNTPTSQTNLFGGSRK